MYRCLNSVDFIAPEETKHNYRYSVVVSEFGLAMRFLFMINTEHVLDQIQHLVAVAPLVVVPGNQLDKVGIEHDARFRIENGGTRIAQEIGGNNRVFRIAQNALHLVF